MSIRHIDKKKIGVFLKQSVWSIITLAIRNISERKATENNILYEMYPKTFLFEHVKRFTFVVYEGENLEL